MQKIGMALLFVPLAVLVAGCNGPGSSAPVAATPPAPRADPVLAGAVTGPAGQGLTAGDREIAGKAQFAAIVDGQRRSWRGKGGTFGYISPGPVAAGSGGGCREYTHTIYLNGRPNSARGKACQASPGQWNIVS